jgi:hypothetical protein
LGWFGLVSGRERGGGGLSLSEAIFEPLAEAHGEPFSFLELASSYAQSRLYVSSERVRRRERYAPKIK